jgi:hypothetical protein
MIVELTGRAGKSIVVNYLKKSNMNCKVIGLSRLSTIEDFTWDEPTVADLPDVVKTVSEIIENAEFGTERPIIVIYTQYNRAIQVDAQKLSILTGLLREIDEGYVIIMICSTQGIPSTQVMDTYWKEYRQCR